MIAKPVQAAGTVTRSTIAYWNLLYNNVSPAPAFATPESACAAAPYTLGYAGSTPVYGGLNDYCYRKAPGALTITRERLIYRLYAAVANATYCGGVSSTADVCTCNATFVPNTTATACICPTGTQLNAAGTACVEQFTLTLNVPAGDLEPSGTAAGDANSSKAMWVFVKSVQTGLAKSGAVVRITLDAVAGSGGHLHNELGPNARPKGTLVKGSLPTDRLDCTPTAGILGSYDCKTLADGYAYFTYFAPIVSGTYAITTACTSVTCNNYSQSTVVDVKVAGLSQIPASSLYALTEADGSVIGAKAGRHTDNHNMTPAAADALWRLAARYRFESKFQQGAGTTPRILFLNDASLPWGGVYDIITVWQPPHLEHRRGTVVDVRANGTAGAMPNGSIKNRFEDMLKKEQGISYLHENPGTTNEHFHIRLQGRRE
jgi:hypothetical protein